MKKFLFAIVCMVICILKTYAQNDTIFYITQLDPYHTTDLVLCDNQYNRVLIYAPEDCDDFHWEIGGYLIGTPYTSYDNPIIFDSQEYLYFMVTFYGCGLFPMYINISFLHIDFPSEMTTTIWKHRNGSTELNLDTLPEPSQGYLFFLWSTGETTPNIEVSEPGTYTCDISHMCTDATYTFIVQDNVEIYRSTVDLETNLNKVTWQVTAEQAEYISQVKVERDGFVVGTAPYEQGYFLDNIGSENAARNYRVTAIDTNGNECPIPSYQKGTLHVDYSPNASNPNKLNMAWTAPFIEEGTPVAVTYFQICKYDPATQEVTVIDQLGANNTIGSYDYSLFDGGYATVAALFSDTKDYENVSFSNLTDEILGVGEVWEAPFRVYPNPSNGKITVEGNGHLSVKNVLGQEIMTKEIENTINLELSKGIYFVEMNGRTQKVVVE